MKLTTLIGVLAAALLLGSACSVQVGSNINNANSTNKPANTSNAAPSNTNSAATSNTSTSSNAASNTNSSSASNKGAQQDFTLDNETGVEIHKVYISPHDSNDWEEDILGRDTLPSGQSVDIKFDRSEKAAMWDLRVEDSQGNPIEWENLNLLKISKVTLHYKDGKAWADTE